MLPITINTGRPKTVNVTVHMMRVMSRRTYKHMVLRMPFSYTCPLMCAVRCEGVKVLMHDTRRQATFMHCSPCTRFQTLEASFRFLGPSLQLGPPSLGPTSKACSLPHQTDPCWASTLQACPLSHAPEQDAAAHHDEDHQSSNGYQFREDANVKEKGEDARRAHRDLGGVDGGATALTHPRLDARGGVAEGFSTGLSLPA